MPQHQLHVVEEPGIGAMSARKKLKPYQRRCISHPQVEPGRVEVRLEVLRFAANVLEFFCECARTHMRASQAFELVDEVGALFAKTKPGYDYEAVKANLAA